MTGGDIAERERLARNLERLERFWTMDDTFMRQLFEDNEGLELRSLPTLHKRAIATNRPSEGKRPRQAALCRSGV